MYAEIVLDPEKIRNNQTGSILQGLEDKKLKIEKNVDQSLNLITDKMIRLV